jgi:hypothetical protein
MAIQSINTTFVGGEDKSNNVEHVQVNLGAASGTFSVLAPCKGRLVGAFVQSQTTTDGTNTVTLALTNESNSAAAMIASTTYDADPVLTSNTAAQLTLSTTAANLDVDLNDQLELAYTEAGIIAGGAVILYFQAAQS